MIGGSDTKSKLKRQFIESISLDFYFDKAKGINLSSSSLKVVLVREKVERELLILA